MRLEVYFSGNRETAEFARKANEFLYQRSSL
jgi:hypothetical protein